MMNIEAFQLYEGTVRLLSDRATKPVDVISFHTRSFGDATNLLEIAAEQFRLGNTAFVEITNNQGERFGSTTKYEANPGKDYYTKRLQGLGVPRNRIAIPRTKAFHTREENTAFIRQAKYRRWTTGILLAQPHQLVRVMLGAIQAIDRVGYQVELYTITPPNTSWQESVKGNQGTEKKARKNHIKDEFVRIFHYQGTGELATFRSLFEYLDARDARRLVLGDLTRGSKRIAPYLPEDL